MKVYLSSTISDLVAERQAVRQIFAKASHAVQESYSAEACALVNSIKADIDNCDAFVGIVGLRYGHCPTDPKAADPCISITEIEYDHAIERQLPCYIFIKNEDAHYQLALTDKVSGENRNGDLILRFRERLLSGDYSRPKVFSDQKELEEELIKLAATLREKVSNWKDQSQRKISYTPPQKFQDILDGIEALPDGSVGRLHSFFTHYLGDSAHPIPFGGRQNDINLLNEWIRTEETPFMVVSAPAGRGKSALAVRWANSLRQNSGLSIAFLPISIRYETALKKTCLSILAARLMRLHRVEHPFGLEVADEYLSSLVFEYLSKDAPAGVQIVVIIDGVDEAIDWKLGPTIVPFHPGERVKILVTARATATRNSAEAWVRSLEWDRACLSGAHDLVGLDHLGIQDVLRQMGKCDDETIGDFALVNELFRLSEGGDPLLIGLYVGAIWAKSGFRSFISIGQLSEIRKIGLEGFFDGWWEDQHQLWGKEFPLAEAVIADIFTILSGALGPIDIDTLKRILPQNHARPHYALREYLRHIDRFIIGNGLDQGYTFAHPRLCNFFWEKLSDSQQKAVNRIFVNWGMEILDQLASNNDGNIPSYAFNYISSHFERAGLGLKEMQRLLGEPWLRAWDDHEGTYAGYLSDVERVMRCARAASVGGILGQDWEPTIIWFKCSLLISSINSLACSVPAGLAVAMLRNGYWTPSQVMSFAQSNADPATRGEFLSIVAGSLVGDQREKAIGKALDVLRHFPADERRARIVENLALLNDPNWADLLLSATEEIEEEKLILRCVRALRPTLSREHINRQINQIHHMISEACRAEMVEICCSNECSSDQVSRLIEELESFHLEPNIFKAIVALAKTNFSDLIIKNRNLIDRFIQNPAYQLRTYIALDQERHSSEIDVVAMKLSRSPAGRHARVELLKVAAEVVDCGHADELEDIASTVAEIPDLFQIKGKLAQRFNCRWEGVLSDIALIPHSSQMALALTKILELIAYEKHAAVLVCANSIRDPFWRLRVLAALSCKSAICESEFQSEISRLDDQEIWGSITDSICKGAKGNSPAARYVLECRSAVSETGISNLLERAAHELPEDLEDASFEAMARISDPILLGKALVSVCARFPSRWESALARSIQSVTDTGRGKLIGIIATQVPPHLLFDLRSRTRRIGDERERRDALVQAFRQLNAEATAEQIGAFLELLASEIPGKAMLEVISTVNIESKRLLCDAFVEQRNFEEDPLNIVALFALADLDWLASHCEVIRWTTPEVQYFCSVLGISRSMSKSRPTGMLQAYIKQLDAPDACRIIVKFCEHFSKDELDFVQKYCLSTTDPNLQWLQFLAVAPISERSFIDAFAECALDGAYDELKIHGYEIICEGNPSHSGLSRLAGIARASGSWKTKLILLELMTRSSQKHIRKELVDFAAGFPRGMHERVGAFLLIQKAYGGVTERVDDSLSYVKSFSARALAHGYMWTEKVSSHSAVAKAWLQSSIAHVDELSFMGISTDSALDLIRVAKLMDQLSNEGKKDQALRRVLRDSLNMQPYDKIKCLIRLFDLYPERRKALVNICLYRSGEFASVLDYFFIQEQVADAPTFYGRQQSIMEREKRKRVKRIVDWASKERKLFVDLLVRIEGIDINSKDGILCLVDFIHEDWSRDGVISEAIRPVDSVDDRILILLSASNGKLTKENFSRTITCLAWKDRDLFAEISTKLEDYIPKTRISIDCNCSAIQVQENINTNNEAQRGDIVEGWGELMRKVSSSGRSSAIQGFEDISVFASRIGGNSLVQSVARALDESCNLIP